MIPAYKRGLDWFENDAKVSVKQIRLGRFQKKISKLAQKTKP